MRTLASVTQPRGRSAHALDDLARLYETMLRVRRVEERIITQYAEQNAVFARKEVPAHSIRCPTHLSIGQERPPRPVCAARSTRPT